MPKWLEKLSTTYLLASIVLCIFLPGIAISIVLYLELFSIDKVATFVDASIKVTAVFVGCVWALNRLFSHRTDNLQFRVDADVDVVRFDGMTDALLIYRLDIVNTGKILIPEFDQLVEVQTVSPIEGKTKSETIFRWPHEGTHHGGPIEPGSWAAINDEICCSNEIKAARIYVEVKLPSGEMWNWHKTFNVAKVENR